MINRVVLDVLFNVFAIFIAISMTAFTDVGTQPDTPNFIMIEIYFPKNKTGQGPTIRSDGREVPVRAIFAPNPNPDHGIFCLYLLVPAAPGEYNVSFPETQESHTIWDRNGVVDDCVGCTKSTRTFEVR